MQHSYDLNHIGANPVNRDERQAGDDQLARSRDASRPPDLREPLQLLRVLLDRVTDVDRCPWIFFGDMFDNARQIVLGSPRPSQAHL